MQAKIGLVAGNRLLPLEFCRIYKKKFPKNKIYAVCIKRDTSKKIEKLTDYFIWIEPKNFEKGIEFFKKQAIKEAIFLGQITPLRLFKDQKDFSPFLKKLLDNLKDWRPDSILGGLAKILESEGIQVLDSRSYLEEILAPSAVFSERPPTPEEKEDIEFGRKIAKVLTKLDIGQTIVVKNKMVLSIEGFEGTDSTILRAKKVTQFSKGGVVIKVAGFQDLRFDIPVVGPKTIKVTKKANLSCLALEKAKTFILEKEKFVELANKFGISLIGIEL